MYPKNCILPIIRRKIYRFTFLFFFYRFHVCSVGYNEVIISQSNYDFIHLMKYTMDCESKSLLRTTSLEEVSGALENVCCIQGQPQGVVGYTKDGLLHIW